MRPASSHREIKSDQDLTQQPSDEQDALTLCVSAPQPQKYAIGYKNITANDNFFTGHFPERKIMPGAP